MAQRVTLLEWVEGLYAERTYHPGETIHSTVLQDLDLTVDRVLAGK